MSRTALALERLAIGLAALALSVGLIAVLSGFFAGRDQAGVAAGTTTPPGQAFADQGDGHLRRGQTAPAYDSNPPTSGPHHIVLVERDAAPISDDQLLEALELGDVVLFYGGPQPPPALRALARAQAAPFSPALVAAGQAVILAPRPGTRGVIAVAWTHMLRAGDPGSAALRQFVAYWLGRGAHPPPPLPAAEGAKATRTR